MLTKQEKVKAIYKKIADKTLSFGCILKEPYEGKYYIHTILELINENKYYYTRTLDGTWKFNKNKTEIIGHPVNIGDLLDYENINGKYIDLLGRPKGYQSICDKWEYKRKPIEEQSEDCIDFVFNLIKELEKGTQK